MNNIRSLLRKKFLWKIGALYLCIFLLPTVVISTVVLRYTMSQFGERLLNQQALVSVNSIARLEKWSETCESILTQLSSGDILRQDLSLYSHQTELQQSLHQLTVAHNGLSYIWYYMPQSDRFLSGDDSLTAERMNSGRFVFLGELSGPSALESLLNGQSLRAYDYQNNSNCVLLPYSFNLYHQDGIHRHLIVFQIRQEYLNQELQNAMGISSGLVSLYDANHELLASIQQGAQISASVDDAAMQAFDILSYSVYGCSWNDGEHLRFAIKTRGQHWTMEGLYQDTSGTASMLSIQQRLLLLCASLFAIGMIAAIIIIYRLYRPVRTLRATASQLEWQDASEPIEDDYEYIESCIDHIAIDNAGLKEKLRQHRQRSRKMIAGLLFEGHIQDADELSSLYDGENRNPVSERYVIAALLCETKIQQEYCQRYLEDEQFPFALPFRDGCLLLYLGSAPEANAFARSGIRSFLQVEGRRLADVPVYCAQVLFMLSGGMTSLDEALTEKNAGVLHLVQQEKKTGFLRKWYEGAVQEAPLETVRALAWLILTTSEEEGPGRVETPEWFYLPDSLSTEICLERGSCFLELLETRFNASAEESTSDYDLMKAYIATQFDSPSFSIKKMAQDFSMSISSLSSYFKQQSGILLSDYIADMKMDKARHLLKTTTMSVNDISLAVGYYNTTSFIRRFQQWVGMSPKEYRTADEHVSEGVAGADGHPVDV